jgi:hypothetical protein
MGHKESRKNEIPRAYEFCYSFWLYLEGFILLTEDNKNPFLRSCEMTVALKHMGFVTLFGYILRVTFC